MGRFYEVVKDVVVNPETGPESAGPQRAIFGKRADAKAQGKAWNGDKPLRGNTGIEIIEHSVPSGKPALLMFLNRLVGNEELGQPPKPAKAVAAPKKKR